jgi:hypothetical protein
MPDLPTVLSQARERIVRHRGAAIGEQNTKATLIEPILRALGWDLEDLDEVRREYRRRPADNPVDYALHLLRTPRLFVEAKGLDENLDDARWANQIMSYAVVAGVQWVLLTNGDEYRIYNTHAPVPVEEKLFRAVRLSEEGARAEDVFDLIAKDRLRENAIDALWKAHFVDRQLRTVIEGLFAGIPDPSLVRIIAKRVPALSRADVRAGLTRARVHLDFPIEPAVAGAPGGGGGAVLRLIDSDDEPRAPARRRADRVPRERRPRRPGVRPDVTLAQLIAAGLITPPLELEKTYLGHRLTAQVEADGNVTFRGQRYASLSTAGSLARASVPGAPTSRPLLQTNGWAFWRFRDGDGRLKPISELRERYQGRATVSTGAEGA